MGSHSFGLDPEFVARIAEETAEVAKSGVEVGVVIGGGNIFRGVSGSARGMERTTADHMGMLATVMNCLALSEALKAAGVKARVMTGLEMPRVAESFTRREADRRLSEGEVVLFAGGTGNPYFTTDTAAALRAAEIGANLLVKGTKVDGVYAADPVTHPDAERFHKLSFKEVLDRGLRVMDLTAVTLARDNGINIFVCSIMAPGALLRAMEDHGLGTLITEEGT